MREEGKLAEVVQRGGGEGEETIRATHLHPHVRMYFYLSSLIGTFLRLLNSSAEMAIMAVYRCMCVRYTRVPTL